MDEDGGHHHRWYYPGGSVADHGCCHAVARRIHAADAGAITAIDTAANTVVVEVQQGKKPFTIGGPLSPKAVVKKGGKTVSLSALQVGDHVRVHWEQTADGPRITQLEASK